MKLSLLLLVACNETPEERESVVHADDSAGDSGESGIDSADSADSSTDDSADSGDSGTDVISIIAGREG